MHSFFYIFLDFACFQKSQSWKTKLFWTIWLFLSPKLLTEMIHTVHICATLIFIYTVPFPFGLLVPNDCMQNAIKLMFTFQVGSKAVCLMDLYVGGQDFHGSIFSSSSLKNILSLIFIVLFMCPLVYLCRAMYVLFSLTVLGGQRHRSPRISS